MKTEKRILFSFWDGGHGHLGRILPIAKSLYAQGYKIGIIASKKFTKYLSQIEYVYMVFEVNNRKTGVHPPQYAFPVYSHAFTHAQRLKGLQFDDTIFLEETIKKEIEVINLFKPNVIINDYRDTIKIASEISGIPIIGITTSNGNSAGYPMGWWITPPADLILADCRNSFNHLRCKYGLDPIINECESFEGDVCIIPSSETIDPLLTSRTKDVYVGVLHKTSVPTIPPSYIKNRKIENKKLVFWYMGEGNNRPIFDFDSILYDVSKKVDAVFVTAGCERRYPKMTKAARENNNIITKSFFEAAEYSWLLKRSSLIINQGGSTAMLGLALGIPFIAIPWNSEPSMAIWGSKFGAGIHLPHSKRPLERMAAPDLGKDVEIMGHWQSDLDANQLEQSINAILSKPLYSSKAEELAVELDKYDGINKIIEIVNSMT